MSLALEGRASFSRWARGRGDTQHPGDPPAASSHASPSARHLLLHGVPALQAAVVGSLHAQQHLRVKLQRLGLGKVTEKGHGGREEPVKWLPARPARPEARAL